jgi:hypothetical protein
MKGLLLWLVTVLVGAYMVFNIATATAASFTKVSNRLDAIASTIE